MDSKTLKERAELAIIAGRERYRQQEAEREAGNSCDHQRQQELAADRIIETIPRLIEDAEAKQLRAVSVMDIEDADLGPEYHAVKNPFDRRTFKHTKKTLQGVTLLVFLRCEAAGLAPDVHFRGSILPRERDSAPRQYVNFEKFSLYVEW